MYYLPKAKFKKKSTLEDNANDVFAKEKAKPLSWSEATKLFDEIADMQDIAFGYTIDGCHSRAHIMCGIAMERSLEPLKAWAFEGDEKLIPYKDRPNLDWWYHVAMALPVKLENGEVEALVFDPSLFDAPVSLDEWGDIMSAEKDKLHICNYGTPPPNYSGDYKPYRKTEKTTDIEAADEMIRFLDKQGSAPRTVFPSKLKQRQSPESTPVQGRTWQVLAI